MANQYLREMAPDGQVLVDMRPTNRAMNWSNWFRSLLTGAAIATLISLITILFFEWYLFTVVDGLAVTLSPIAETLRRIEGYPPTRPSFRDLKEPQSLDYASIQTPGIRTNGGASAPLLLSPRPLLRCLRRTNAELTAPHYQSGRELLNVFS